MATVLATISIATVTVAVVTVDAAVVTVTVAALVCNRCAGAGAGAGWRGEGGGGNADRAADAAEPVQDRGGLLRGGGAVQK